MENEMMDTYEEMNPEVENVGIESDVETEDSGLGTGVAMLIGAGLTLAVTAAVKLGKKAYAKFKAKKEAKEDEEEANERDFVIPSDEEIKNVTK